MMFPMVLRPLLALSSLISLLKRKKPGKIIVGLTIARKDDESREWHQTPVLNFLSNTQWLGDE